MNLYLTEKLVAIFITLLFYMVIKKNNILIINPNKDQMKNVIYNTDCKDDINIMY